MKNRYKQYVITIIALFVSQTTCSVSADSLWGGMASSDTSYFVNTSTHTRNINDIVFIYISEATTANVTSDQDFETETGIKGGFESWFNVDGWRDISDFFLQWETPQIGTRVNDSSNMPTWEFNVDNEFEGEAESIRSNLVQTKIAARIIEIKPNGNFLLEGKRAITINQELSQLLLTGVARPDDIDENNQIESNKIADLRISVVGKGEVTKASSRGVLNKLLDLMR